MVVKIVYEYDGSKFFGMQRQKDKITVQQSIEEVVENVFKQKINLISSGRTDAKVHALMQVSNFEIDKNIPLNAIKNQINKNLFGLVKVYEISKENENFNSRFDAKKRTYVYYIKKSSKISPFEANYITKIEDRLEINVDEINKKLKLFIGEHDFSCYCKREEKEKNKVRFIYEAYCEYENDILKITISAQSFLRSMVRLISASCIYDSYEEIKNKLHSKQNKKTKKILSPNGLYLKEVIY